MPVAVTIKAQSGIEALTEREKQTLRLLIGGHDAKSLARVQGLSVHTVNERLRDARRKLSVSSSREAARILSEAETGAPDFFADEQIGVFRQPLDVSDSGQPDRQENGSQRLAWIAGGMFIMSLFIAAAALSSAFQGGRATDIRENRVVPVSAPRASSAEAAAVNSAQTWVAQLDRGHWEASWRTASTLFKSQISASQWASVVQPVRQPLGRLLSRKFLSATRATTLPGAPVGDYVVVQFKTAFASKNSAVETITLAREGTQWRVAGYFVR